MKIETEMSRDDYRKLHRYNFYHFRKTYLLYVAAFIIVLLLGWPWGEPFTIGELLVYVLSTFLIFLFLYGVFRVVQFIVQKFTRKTYSPILGKHTFEILDDAFVEKNITGTTRINYEVINHIANTKKHFFVYTTNGMALLIPKRAFPDVNQENQFLALLNQKIMDRKPAYQQVESQ